MTHRKYNRKRDKGLNTFCEENDRTDQCYGRGYQKEIFFQIIISTKTTWKRTNTNHLPKTGEISVCEQPHKRKNSKRKTYMFDIASKTRSQFHDKSSMNTFGFRSRRTETYHTKLQFEPQHWTTFPTVLYLPLS